MSNAPGSYMDESEPAFHAETSVERALNSRCSSDADGDQMKAHWGMYDKQTPISPELIGAVEQGVQVPRFTYHELHVDLDQRPIALSMSNDVKGIQREWLHIESGMQHQAVYLVCSALGMGTCITNMGIDGTPQRSGRLGTVRMGLEMMRPSYGDVPWSTEPPSDWQSDTRLPDPRRDSDYPLLKAMENASTRADGRAADSADISQLLWAGRGRTPHWVYGRLSGLTIPTWAGGQDIASADLASSDGLFRYVNTAGVRSAHTLGHIKDDARIPGSAALILLAVNESAGRALWEVGYMLENLILQATALGLQYEAILLADDARRSWEQEGILGVRALFTLRAK